MPLNSFSPNTKIQSAQVNSNFTNFSNHGRNITLQWIFVGTLTTQTSTDWKSLPDDVTWDRADIAVNTAPTGAAVIADIERSTDNGGTWVTVFTNSANRPQIAAGSRVGSTTTVDVSAGTKNAHLFRAKISQIGSTVAGANLSVFLKGKYNLD